MSIDKKEGRYSDIIGRKCFIGLTGKNNKMHLLGCNRKNAIKEATNIANKKRTDVLILKEVAGIRFVSEQELKEIEETLKEKFKRSRYR
ncbi:unnamed protein product, partial [marine sediment metagenome]